MMKVDRLMFTAFRGSGFGCWTFRSSCGPPLMLIQAQAYPFTRREDDRYRVMIMAKPFSNMENMEKRKLWAGKSLSLPLHHVVIIFPI